MWRAWLIRFDLSFSIFHFPLHPFAPSHYLIPAGAVNMRILVTGCSGLIGSEAVSYFDRKGYSVTGIDNNMRQVFFGPAGDTSWNLSRLQKNTLRFNHVNLDIRDRDGLFVLFREA